MNTTRLREALVRLLDAADETGVIQAGGDPGCPECTEDTTPSRLRTGPCPFHAALAILRDDPAPEPAAWRPTRGEMLHRIETVIGICRLNDTSCRETAENVMKALEVEDFCQPEGDVK